MKPWRVLELSGITHCPEAFDGLREVAEITHAAPSPKALADQLPAHDAYFATLEVRLTRDIIETCPDLRAVATSSTGTDHLDVEALRERGIRLVSLTKETAFLNDVTCTAEMGWALLLAVVRKLPWSFEAAKRGHWARDLFRGHQLSGKTLGILGYGRLGRIMAEIGNGFRMRVLANDVKPAEPAPYVTPVDLDTLLRESDVVSVHIHLTPENTGLIDAGVFARMKPGAILVNTSRGAIVDESALLAALESGRLGGAGLDVIHGEWDRNLKDHPLIRYANEHDNLVISPHTGGVTFEAQAMAMRFTADKLAQCLRELKPPRSTKETRP
jgi:D-3-phosphoglycerate dehydrogenase